MWEEEVSKQRQHLHWNLIDSIPKKVVQLNWKVRWDLCRMMKCERGGLVNGNDYTEKGLVCQEAEHAQSLSHVLLFGTP